MKKLLFLLLSLQVVAKGQIITTVAGNGTNVYNGDGGAADSAGLYHALKIATDISGNLYIADAGHARIRKVNTSGIISTIVGNGTFGYSGDGGPASAAIVSQPFGIVLDKIGNLYFTDGSDNRIRKIDTLGIITTIAGTGVAGDTGDGGLAILAEFHGPGDIAIDTFGNLYVADVGNRCVRKIDKSGIVTRVAGGGTAGLNDGGLAVDGQLVLPYGISVDVHDNLYIADYNNNTRVRKVDTAGIITTIAGNGINGYSGDGGPADSAELYFATAVAVDKLGDIYIADATNSLIRMVNTAGIISTIVGAVGICGFSGDGGDALFAELCGPSDIKVDDGGNLFIADWGNNRIRHVNSTLIVNSASRANKALSIYPNPVTTQLTISSSENIAAISITNLLGQTVYSSQYSGSLLVSVDVAELPRGVYFVRVNNVVRKFVKE